MLKISNGKCMMGSYRSANIHIEIDTIGNKPLKVMRKQLLCFYLFPINETGNNIVYKSKALLKFSSMKTPGFGIRINDRKVFINIGLNHWYLVAQMIK